MKTQEMKSNNIFNKMYIQFVIQERELHIRISFMQHLKICTIFQHDFECNNRNKMNL